MLNVRKAVKKRSVIEQKFERVQPWRGWSGKISQEAGKVVWYSHLLKNFPQFVVIHTVKGFGVVNKAEADVFCNFIIFSTQFFLIGSFPGT